MIEKTKKLNVTVQKQIKQIKIALIGDSLTGKSAFLHKLLTGQFKQSYESTLGVETGVKTVQNQNGTTTNLTIWDFSGKLDFVEIRNQFYKEADFILLFMDLSTKNTIDSIEYWLRQAKDNGAGSVYAVGNKADIKKINDADKISKQKGCNAYFEISSKTGDGIQEMIKKIMAQFK